MYLEPVEHSPLNSKRMMVWMIGLLTICWGYNLATPPSDIPCHLANAMLGVTALELKKVPEGIVRLRLALALNPYDYHSANNLGIGYAMVRDLDRAEYCWLWALSVAPKEHYSLIEANMQRMYQQYPRYFKAEPSAVSFGANSTLSGEPIVMIKPLTKLIQKGDLWTK